MKKEDILKKKISFNSLFPLKTSSNTSQQMKQQPSESTKKPELNYFAGDECSLIEIADLLDKYDVERWQKKFYIETKKINKRKYLAFLKKYVYNKLVIPYLCPYKFNSIIKRKTKIKENDIPLIYDYYMGNNLLLNQKSLLSMKFRDNEIFIDEYDYLIQYFELKKYYAIMRYLLTFIYNKDPLSMIQNFYYKNHNDKLERDFKTAVKTICKFKLIDSSKKIIKKKYNYFFIKDVPTKNIPNITPNYFNNEEEVKILFKKYTFKQKFSKIGEEEEKLPIKKENNKMKDDDYILKDLTLSLEYPLYNNQFYNISQKEDLFHENKNKNQVYEDEIIEINELIDKIDKAEKPKNDNQNNMIKIKTNNKCVTDNLLSINTEKDLFSKKKEIFKKNLNKQNIKINSFNDNSNSNKSSITPLSFKINPKNKLILVKNQKITTINNNNNIFMRNSFLINNNQYSSFHTLNSQKKNLKVGSDFIRNLQKKKLKKKTMFQDLLNAIQSPNNFLQRNNIILTNNADFRFRDLPKIKKEDENFIINKKRLCPYKSFSKKEMKKVISKKNLERHKFRAVLSYEGLIRSKK